ncbi:MAG: hypothetical protein HZB56_17180 [Deltaproteobacteria bacterium]|nr:hypothetical protein [Deltaproteobacteria bacterium]
MPPPSPLSIEQTSLRSLTWLFGSQHSSPWISNLMAASVSARTSSTW